MNNEFKEIIMGNQKPTHLRQYISDQSGKILEENSYLKKWEKVSELFLEYANKKYREGVIDNMSVNGLLEAYDNFISNDPDVHEYLLKKVNNSIELEKINHSIINMTEQFIEKENYRRAQKIKSLKREYGFVHPLLLAIITGGIGFIFLANLYLAI